VIAAAVGSGGRLAIGGYLFGAAASATPAAAPAAAPLAAPAPTGMTPEQIQAMIQEALANQKKQTESDSGRRSKLAKQLQ
jgi:hypothetical protein